MRFGGRMGTQFIEGDTQQKEGGKGEANEDP
jgi:hypothetical protein